jgi:uncharacterized protein YqjF (DUF2071 family)
MATFLEAEWRYLAMAHYRVERELLTRFVPSGTELDEWSGRTHVTLVAFRFLRTRILGIGVPGHRNFDEINLRLYVRRRVDGEIRRGVVFIKDIVAVPGVALAARLTYNEKYELHQTRSKVPRTPGAPPDRLRYEWRSGSGWNRLAMAAGDGPFVATPGSEEHFVTDRPWGYTRQRDGGTIEYRVAHPPWRLWRAVEVEARVHATELYGPEFEPVLGGEPDLSIVAEGSPVSISSPSRIA